MLAAEQGGAPAALEAELLQRTSRDGAIGPGLCARLHRQRDFKVIAALAAGRLLAKARRSPALIAGGQPLFMFGERAGMHGCRASTGQDWFATVELTQSRDGAAVVMVPQTRCLPIGARPSRSTSPSTC